MPEDTKDYPLKPCPFCGATAEFVEYYSDDCRSPIEYMVCCTGEHSHQLDYISDKQDLMEIWNERAPFQILPMDLVRPHTVTEPPK